MIEIPTNPDVETLKLILWLSGALIALFVMAISFFLRQIVLAVDILKKAVAVIETQQNMQYPVIEKRLNSHASDIAELSDDISELSDRITAIETKCNIYHKIN